MKMIGVIVFCMALGPVLPLPSHYHNWDYYDPLYDYGASEYGDYGSYGPHHNQKKEENKPKDPPMLPYWPKIETSTVKTKPARYPIEHPLHNHPPGHHLHRPHLPWGEGNDPFPHPFWPSTETTTAKTKPVQYPFGHPLHNHPPGHPWHRPHVPWEKDMEDKPHNPFPHPFWPTIETTTVKTKPVHHPLEHPLHNHPPGHHPTHALCHWPDTAKSSTEYPSQATDSSSKVPDHTDFNILEAASNTVSASTTKLETIETTTKAIVQRETTAEDQEKSPAVNNEQDNVSVEPGAVTTEMGSPVIIPGNVIPTVNREQDKLSGEQGRPVENGVVLYMDPAKLPDLPFIVVPSKNNTDDTTDIKTVSDKPVISVVLPVIVIGYDDQPESDKPNTLPTTPVASRDNFRGAKDIEDPIDDDISAVYSQETNAEKRSPADDFVEKVNTGSFNPFITVPPADQNRSPEEWKQLQDELNQYIHNGLVKYYRNKLANGTETDCTNDSDPTAINIRTRDCAPLTNNDDANEDINIRTGLLKSRTKRDVQKDDLVQQINSGVFNPVLILPPGDLNTNNPQDLKVIEDTINESIRKGLVTYYLNSLQDDNNVPPTIATEDRARIPSTARPDLVDQINNNAFNAGLMLPPDVGNYTAENIKAIEDTLTEAIRKGLLTYYLNQLNNPGTQPTSVAPEKQDLADKSKAEPSQDRLVEQINTGVFNPLTLLPPDDKERSPEELQAIQDVLNEAIRKGLLTYFMNSLKEDAPKPDKDSTDSKLDSAIILPPGEQYGPEDMQKIKDSIREAVQKGQQTYSKFSHDLRASKSV